MTQSTLPGGYSIDTDGTVTVGVMSLPTNFNPSTPAGDNRITQLVMEQVWPQPFVTEPGFGVENSGLLESAEVQGVSPLTVVYVINPKAVWSDGVPITVADFEYSWHEHLSSSAPLPDSGLVAGYRDIASIVGSHKGDTVTVTFSQPFSQWQSLFANLVPAHVAEKYGWSAAFTGYTPDRVISGGPFEVTSYVAGKYLVLSRNPRYWGTRAHVAHIRFVVEQSQSALVNGLTSGQLSVAEVAASQSEPNVLAAGAVGIKDSSPGNGASSRALEWTGTTASEIWQLCFNFDDPLISNVAVRRGIEHSLDPSEIVADSEDLVDPAISVADSRLALAGENSSKSSSGAAPAAPRTPVLYEPAVALALFRQAGYTPGAGGLLRLAGVGAPLVVTLLEPRGDWPVDQAGLEIQGELRALGVTVHLQRRELSTMLSKLLPGGSYQLALAPFEVSPTLATVAPEYSDPVLPQRGGVTSVHVGDAGLLSSGGQTWSTQVPLGTEPGAWPDAGAVTRDVSGVDDPGINSELSNALGELDAPTALADLQKVENRMWNQVVSIPLFQPGLDLVRSVRLDNVSESPTWAGFMWDAEDWALVTPLPKATTTTVASGDSGG